MKDTATEILTESGKLSRYLEFKVLLRMEEIGLFLA